VSRNDASAYARRIHLEVYRDFFEKVLALPVLIGEKTPRERFAGAVNTLACEAMMGDGKALQVATSHELGQNFATAFDISYTDASGQRQLCWTTSWGSSTRIVGGLIMGHGDDSGLVMPPALAPVQAVVLAVKDDESTLAAAERLHGELLEAGIRTKLDRRTDQGFGRRVTDWELKGVPLRFEVGPRDLAEGVVTVAQRDRAERQRLDLTRVAAVAPELLRQMQAHLFDQARDRLESRTVDVESVGEALEGARDGFARIPWRTLGPEGESTLAEQAVSVRCLQTPDGSLPTVGDDADLLAVVGRSY
jgi:prolyl-tRNA synthetase